jgi:hypothetical protein
VLFVETILPASGAEVRMFFFVNLYNIHFEDRTPTILTLVHQSHALSQCSLFAIVFSCKVRVLAYFSPHFKVVVKQLWHFIVVFFALTPGFRLKFHMAAS